MTLNPAPATYAERGALSGLFQHYVGRVLTQVKYGNLDPHRDSSTVPLVDCVDMALELHFGDLILRFDWAIDGFDEGLAVSFERGMPDVWVHQSMIATPHWRGFDGKCLSGVEFVWHSLERVLLLGVTLLLDDSSVTIALGDVDASGCLGYQPDELIVVFDPDSASRYLASVSALRQNLEEW
ncbi:MAG: hypothetical protein QM582_09040 [Micropruina sp.]|uniref:hypothetical protein n=1 Tax=Micropruina sp. TaxID=2737536 RepID=UPI0039E3E082